MWSGKSLQLLCISLFVKLCLSAISMLFVKNMLAVCMLVGIVVVVVVCPHQPSSSANPGCPGPEISVHVSS